MPLPSPTQTAAFPRKMAELEKWLWDHPSGGEFQINEKDEKVAVAIGTRLQQELVNAGWSAELGLMSITIEPRTTPGP
jgi:hypothetical protein